MPDERCANRSHQGLHQQQDARWPTLRHAAGVDLDMKKQLRLRSALGEASSRYERIINGRPQPIDPRRFSDTRHSHSTVNRRAPCRGGSGTSTARRGRDTDKPTVGNLASAKAASRRSWATVPTFAQLWRSLGLEWDDIDGIDLLGPQPADGIRGLVGGIRGLVGGSAASPARAASAGNSINGSRLRVGGARRGRPRWSHPGSRTTRHSPIFRTERSVPAETGSARPCGT